MLKSLVTSLTLILLFPIYAQLDYVREITKKLTSAEMHGRGYVFGGDSIAADYLASEMKKAGIKPYKKNYYQPFSFEVNTFPGTIELRVGNKPLTLAEDFIVEPESGSFNGKLKLFKITYEDLFDIPDLIERLQRNMANPVGNTYFFDYRVDTLSKEAKGTTYELMNALVQHGNVLGMDDSKWNWSVGRKQFKNAMVWIRSSVTVEEEMNLIVEAKFNPKHQTQNVIGYIPAKKKSKKTFVFTAHYDHLGRLGQEIYFPGANDNASGTAALLAIGKYFSENPADFNVLLIAFAGEEAGLVGSEYYVNHPWVKLNKINFLMNVDIFGSGEIGITVVNGSVYPEAYDALVKINEEKQYVDRIKARGKAANSDHYHFSERGVPAFFIYTEGDNKHYHDIFDTYENLTFAKAEDLIQLLIEFSKQMVK